MLLGAVLIILQKKKKRENIVMNNNEITNTLVLYNEIENQPQKQTVLKYHSHWEKLIHLIGPSE